MGRRRSGRSTGTVPQVRARWTARAAVDRDPQPQGTTSSNWSGYAAETNLNNATSGSVTAVSGTWKVPNGHGQQQQHRLFFGLGRDRRLQLVFGRADRHRLGHRQRAGRVLRVVRNVSVGLDERNQHDDFRRRHDQRLGDLLTSGTHAGQFQLTITDASKTNDTFTIYETASSVARSSAEWVVEAPSSSSGVLPLANFGSVTFTNATATINGKTGAIDSSTWQDASIDMVSYGSAVEASTSGLTDSGGTSSFTVTDSVGRGQFAEHEPVVSPFGRAADERGGCRPIAGAVTSDIPERFWAAGQGCVLRVAR